MGSSFTEYDGHGFWARDEQVELWLALMVRQIDTRAIRTPAQKRIRDDFIVQATGGFLGFVSPGLDDHVTEATRDWMIENSRLALETLKAQGDVLQVPWVNDLFLCEGSLLTEPFWNGPSAAAARYRDYGRKWIALLTGDFTLKDTAWIGDIHAADAHPRMKPG